MLYNFIEDIKKNNIVINGILHIGAHDGEELNTYIKNNIDNVIFVEANPVIYERLVNRCQSQTQVLTHTYNVGISNKKQDDVIFYVTNNDSASSSILKLKEHMFEYPDINVVKNIKINTTTIDALFTDNNLLEQSYNVLNMDIQGAEAMALMGATKYLKKCEAIYLEVNFREMYKECSLLNDIDTILSSYFFKRVKLIDTGRGWGDALYIKNKD